MTTEAKGRIGSSFDDFLAEEGILEECEAQAIKEMQAVEAQLKKLAGS